MSQAPDRNTLNAAPDSPFSNMSQQLYPDARLGDAVLGGEERTRRQPADGLHDPVHDSQSEMFGVKSNQKLGGDDADLAIELVKNFALHQAWKKNWLTFDEAKNTVLNHVVKMHADPAEPSRSIPALVYTDMTGGRTWFHNPDTNENFEIQTSNAVLRNSLPDADGPYMGNITRCDIGNLGDAYGNAKIYTTDSRSRWIHGGGTGLDSPHAPRQGWVATKGCTRGQNEDVEHLCRKIKQWQQENPDRPILYIRTKSMNP